MEIASGLWVVETPLRFLGMQVGRRMAIVRLDGDRLLIHSPAELTPALEGELAGEVELGDEPDPRWSGQLDRAVLRGHRQLSEVVILHRSSGSLLVGDLCWNVTPAMPLGARLWAGVRTRVTPTPAFRLGIRDRAAARGSIERILAWDFDRILVGHGAVVESGGREALARAYAWPLR